MKNYTPREFLIREDPEALTTVAPQKLFDDLFFVGHKLIGIFILKTSEGLVLFDATDRADAWDHWLLPGLQELGLADQPVKMLFLTHGHFDHYVGARGIQDATGCGAALSEADTAYLSWCHENRDKIPILPLVTRLLKDGEDISFGDHTVHVIFAPGHTPGCLNYSFPVHDNGREHRVIMVGGYGIFGPGNYPDGEYPYGVVWAAEQAFTFAASQVKTWEYVKATGCDVYLNPHPHLCGVLEYAAENENRKAGDPNGLVIGQEGVRKWLFERFEECLKKAVSFTDIGKEMPL